jgi:parallel beta-helix repeat protein
VEINNGSLTVNGGAILTVCPSGCNYTSIGDAIDASKEGDVVEVYSGMYGGFSVDKSIIIRGVDTGEGYPIVNAQPSGRGVAGTAVSLRADGIVLDGLYIVNAGPYPQAGIKVESNNNLISKCAVWNCGQWGIYLKGASNNTVSECICSNNGANGICVWKSHGNLFRENTVSNNGKDGIRIDESHGNLFRENTVSNNGDDGFQITLSDNNIVDRNVVRNNDDIGITINDSQDTTLMNNVISYNSLGVRSVDSSTDKIGRSQFISNTQDIKLV